MSSYTSVSWYYVPTMYCCTNDPTTFHGRWCITYTTAPCGEWGTKANDGEVGEKKTRRARCHTVCVCVRPRIGTED